MARKAEITSVHVGACILTFGIIEPLRAQHTPVDFTVAFIGDPSLDIEADDVLRLILAEGADAVVHSGDFDYRDDPQAWDELVSAVLGPCFPSFAVGNGDQDEWYGAKAYQPALMDRMTCLELDWEDDLRVRSTFTHRGFFSAMTTPNIFGPADGVYDLHVEQQLAATDTIWQISSWHKRMNAMHGHEHPPARTRLRSAYETKTVARRSETVTFGSGETLAFSSGIGGKDPGERRRRSPATPPYGYDGAWGSISADDPNANHGALFGQFNYQGDPCLAHFYFKDVDGAVPDEFLVRSALGTCACAADVDGDMRVSETDLIEVLLAWGPCLKPCEVMCRADVTGDCQVSALDLLALLMSWGFCP